MSNEKEAIIVIYTHKNINTQEIIELKKRQTTYNDRIELLLNTLHNFKNNFLIRYNYPILILCENYDDYDKQYITDTFESLTISFEDINPSIPEYLDKQEITENIARKPVVHWRNLGYRHMCKFYAVDIFTHPIISTYKYYMRLDDDSVITSPIPVNFFKFMTFHKIDYMYRVLQKKDCSICNDGMNDFFKSLGHDFDYNSDLVPFNNFHIMSLDAVKNRNIFENRTIIYNIYNNRWGDAPLHGAYIKMYNLKAVCTENDKYTSFKYMKWGTEFPKNIYTIF